VLLRCTIPAWATRDESSHPPPLWCIPRAVQRRPLLAMVGRHGGSVSRSSHYAQHETMDHGVGKWGYDGGVGPGNCRLAKMSVKSEFNYRPRIVGNGVVFQFEFQVSGKKRPYAPGRHDRRLGTIAVLARSVDLPESCHSQPCLDWQPVGLRVFGWLVGLRRRSASGGSLIAFGAGRRGPLVSATGSPCWAAMAHSPPHWEARKANYCFTFQAMVTRLHLPRASSSRGCSRNYERLRAPGMLRQPEILRCSKGEFNDNARSQYWHGPIAGRNLSMPVTLAARRG
jgi:hypothetical protein